MPRGRRVKLKDKKEEGKDIDIKDAEAIHPEIDKIYSETSAVLYSKDIKLFTMQEDI